MSNFLTLFIMIFIVFALTLTANAEDTNILVLGMYQNNVETIMINMYQSGVYQNQTISIPPGSIFSDSHSILKDKEIDLVIAEEGIEPVQSALAEYFDLEIPYYLIVEYEGAKDVIDAMNGVNFKLPYPIYLPATDDKAELQLKAGLQTFDGETARRFLRYRTEDFYGPAELEIIKLQQLFLNAMVEQLAKEKWKIITIAFKLPKMIKTNIGLFKFLDLGFEAMSMDTEILKVFFGIIPGKFVKINDGYQYHIQGQQSYRCPIDEIED